MLGSVTKKVAAPVGKTTRTDNDDIELETTLQELVLNLLRDGVETNIGG